MILVGVDFDEGSQAALAHARVLSDRSGLPVEALHVREYGEAGGWSPSPAEASWMARVGLSPAELQMRRGVPWVELVRFARERHASFIVVGRHGGAGPQPSFLGGTALRLASHPQDPVLLVSAGPGPRQDGKELHGTGARGAPGQQDTIPGEPTRSGAI